MTSKIKFLNTDVSGKTLPLFTGELSINLPDKAIFIGSTSGTLESSSAVKLNRFYPLSEIRYEQTLAYGVTALNDALFLEVIGCGGGGGGGSGSSIRNPVISGNARSSGGGGGQGGQGGRYIFSLKELGLTSGSSLVSVNIGAGGVGGSSVSSTAISGNPGADGTNSYIGPYFGLTAAGPTYAFITFSGGGGGAAGARPNTSIEADAPETFINDGFTDKVLLNFPGSIPENFGGQGLGGYGIGHTAGEDNPVDEHNGMSSYYGGGGGGGGGGGQVFNVGGVSLGISFAGGFGGKGTEFNNTNYDLNSFNGTPTGNGKTGTFGGSGGGGGDGTIVATIAGGVGGLGATGGGGGGGGGASRQIEVSPVVSSGRGGTGGSGYIILRWW